MKLIRHLQKSSIEFFDTYPAWGLALSIIGAILSPPWVVYLAAFVFFCLKSPLHSFTLLTAHYILSIAPAPLPEAKEPYVLSGVFEPKQKLARASFFKNHTLIRGLFKTESKCYQIELFEKPKTNFLSQSSYITLEVKEGQLTPLSYHKLNTPPILFSFREKISKRFKELIFIPSCPSSSHLLYALLTGQIENRLLKLQFKTYGLAHVLALSGFHLNLIMGFCRFIFLKILKLQKSLWIGLFMLTLYVLFTGGQPSILRAYSMLIFSTFYPRFSLVHKPWHLFSLSLIFTTLLCPYQIKESGFVLTFVATATLLLFSQSWPYVQNYFGTKLSTWDRWILKWLKLLCLQLCIFCSTAPVLVFYFKELSFQSLFYNLFFPWVIAIFMTLGIVCALLKGFLAPLITPIQTLLYQLMEHSLEVLKSPFLQNPQQITLPLSALILYLLFFFFLVCSAFKKKEAL